MNRTAITIVLAFLTVVGGAQTYPSEVYSANPLRKTSVVQSSVPSGFKQMDIGSGNAVRVFRKDYAKSRQDFVTVIDLRESTIRSLTGEVVNAPNGQVYRKTLTAFWNDAVKLETPNQKVKLLINGTFFADKDKTGRVINPTGLSFGLKSNGNIISYGYGLRSEYPGQIKVFAFNMPVPRSNVLAAWIQHHSEGLFNRGLPDSVGALDPEASKDKNAAIPRTFLGLRDDDADGNYEIVVLFSSTAATQSSAASILSSFGATEILMLDGGGSTGLVVDGTPYINTSRTLPHALAIYARNTAPTAAHPDISTIPRLPSNDGSLSGRIVFSSRRDGNQEVYSLDLAAGRQTNLTRNRADDGYPRWSPFGDRIAFATNRDGNWEIYSMNKDGTGQINLTTNAADDGYLDWSADGELLVFASNRNDSRANDILSMRADGSIVTKLITSQGEDVHPVWSPWRTDVAFASERDGNRQIYILDSSSNHVTRLMSNSSYDDYPAWSADGTRIAFASDRDSGSSNRLDIYVATIEHPSRWYNIEGKRTLVRVLGEWNVTSVMRVVSHPSDDRHPTWSPDGKMLAFVSDRDGDRDIFAINADGTGLKKIVGARRDDEHPHWVSDSPAVARRAIPRSTRSEPETSTPTGEELIVKLENPIGTTTHRDRGTEATINRVGDVVNFSVTSPARYRGARISAHIGLIRSSWLSNQQAQLGLMFDSIEFNGETRRFRASIEKVASSPGVRRMRRIDRGYSVSPLSTLRIQRSGDLSTLILDGPEEFGLQPGAQLVIIGRVAPYR